MVDLVTNQLFSTIFEGNRPLSTLRTLIKSRQMAVTDVIWLVSHYEYVRTYKIQVASPDFGTYKQEVTPELTMVGVKICHRNNAS